MVNTFMTYFDLLKNNNDVDDTSTCEDKDHDRHSDLAGAPSPSRDTSDDHYPKIDQHYNYDEDEDYGDEGQEHMADDDDDDDDGNDDDNDDDEDNEEEEEDDENDDDDDDDDDGDDDDDMDDLQEMDRIRRKFDRQLQRMFGGTVSQMSSQFRSILDTLKTQNDPTMQLVALQELAEILSVSNEETLAGYFSSDGFVKELVRILKGSDGNDAGLDLPPGMEMDEDMMLALAMNGGFGNGGNPELMLLACRCLSNLMDALPTSVTNVVYHGATKVLCEKLKSIEYIDLAEQALIVSRSTPTEKAITHLPSFGRLLRR
jgi:E3 ubiquitin-protein ligase TRIP12